MKRCCVLIVLDSVGIGAMPDAADFGDEGSNTLANISLKMGGLELPNLYSLGLANIDESDLNERSREPLAAFGRAAETTRAKDTTSGHWELMGLTMKEPFRTFPQGFPAEFMYEFESKIGMKTLCNKAASGTQIIAELGDEHVRTGFPIIYTSADSVFQIAAHESVIPLDKLYDMCQTARDMLKGDMLIGRVIARPFGGESGSYTRTQNRKDYSIAPPRDTVLDALMKEGLTTVGVGKIEDIFFNRGLIMSDHTHTNEEGIQSILRFMDERNFDFLFANLVDFDMLYGHRNDVEGYAKALEDFDMRLPQILDRVGESCMLIITADHGCDPTTPSTDHSREYIPLIITGDDIIKGKNIGTRSSFADVGATVYEYLTGKKWSEGKSFLGEITD